MKRIVFSLALLAALTIISFAGKSKKDPHHKHQTGVSSNGGHKEHRIIHPVDHFTI